MKLRAVFRIAGLTIFVVLATVLLAIGALWTLAETDWGGDALRRIAVSQIDRRIAGQIAVQRLRFGGDRLTLDGVVLRDPSGAAVARVGRLDLQFSVWPLLRRHVELRRLEILRPELTLTRTQGGASNLAAALAPAHPAPQAAPAPAATKKAGRPNVVVALRALALTDGVVTARLGGPEIHLGAIDVTGSARYAGAAARLDTDLQVATDAGHVTLQGALDLARRRAARSGFSVQVHDLDLGAVIARLPPTQVTLALDAHGARGTADLNVRAPGVVVNGHGTLDGARLDARLRLEASDLGATGASLTRARLAPDLALAGRGRIDLRVGGALPGPSVAVAASFPALSVAGDSARDLTISMNLPHLNVPEAIDLDAAAGDARIKGQVLRKLEAHIQASGRQLEARVRTAAPYPVMLSASGRRVSARTLEIARLTLGYPEETWRLAQATRVSFEEGHTALTGLDLRAGDQIVRADFDRRGRAGHLRATIARLDLGRLPRPLVPPALKRAGTVGLVADVRFSPVRLRGAVTAHGFGTGLHATFDLPPRWPPPRGAPVRLELTTEKTDLGALARTIGVLSGKPLPHVPGGTLRVTATVNGTGARPRLDARLVGRGLALDGRTIGDATLAVEGNADQPLTVTLELAHSQVPPATLKLTSKASLAVLLRHPSAAALERAPFELTGHVVKAPLALLAKLGGTSLLRAGTLSLDLAANGTVAAPTGTLALDVRGAAGPRLPPTDARVELSVDQRSTGANVRVVRQGHPLLALTSHLGAGLTALRDPRTLTDAPIRVRAVVGPLLMRRRGLPGALGEETRDAGLTGTLHADLALDGTLRAPRLLAHVQASNLALEKTRLGAAQVALSYAGRQARLAVTAESANGGTLSLKAGVQADLSLPALRSLKLDPTLWTYDLALEARQLDLRGFSGLTPSLRRAAGLLDAHVTAHGRLADPRFSGRVACKQCELHLTGIGDFRDINLALHGETDKVVLDELSAKSGNGNARITGALSRSPGTDAYQVTGRIAAKELPAYVEGQPLALISLDAALAGTSGGRGSDADLAIEIHDAHIKLSDQKRRELQSLETPADIVLVADGKPIDRQQRRKLQALLQQRAAATRAGQATPTAQKQPASRHGIWKRIKLAVTAPRQIWVNGGGAALELGLQPGFHVILADQVGVHGEVIVRRGRVDVLGRRLDLKADSSLQFDGKPSRPVLDVTAKYQDNDDNVTVLISAKGTLDHLSINITSPNRPDLTESQLYALIITGHLPSNGSSGSAATAASNEATSLVAGVIAGQLQKTLAKHLPLDVLTIDTGNGQGLSGTQLEAGRYITDRLYVGYIGRVGADPTRYQNKNAVHVEYQLTSRWQIAGEYGDIGTGSADLMWKKNY